MQIVRYESTPNPNALKCWLDTPISTRPRSFRSRDDAATDPLAGALFDEAGLTCLLLNGDWMTITRSPGADWSAVKSRVSAILASHKNNEPPSEERGP